jgi:hypothetical protein
VVRLHDQWPGEITIVIRWPSLDGWNAIDAPGIHQRLAAEFDLRFDRRGGPQRGGADLAGVLRWDRVEARAASTDPGRTAPA